MIPTLIFRFIMLLALYLALAGSLDVQELVAGGVIALVLTWAGRRMPPLWRRVRWSAKTPLAAVAFPFVFLKALIHSNLDVAFRVLSPSLPIKPGIVKVETKLQSPMGRLALANAITLTPGTLTVESRDKWLYIHWIDIKDGSVEAATQAIVRQFEKHLEVLFG